MKATAEMIKNKTFKPKENQRPCKREDCSNHLKHYQEKYCCTDCATIGTFNERTRDI